MPAFPGWNNTYPPRAVNGNQTITAAKPGAAISKAIDELQEKSVAAVVSESVGLEAKISGNTLYLSGGFKLPSGTAQYQVLSWSGSDWVADWVRAHA